MSGLERWLEKLEDVVDLDWEREKFERWKSVLNFEVQPEPFEISRSRSDEEPGEWPSVGVNEAMADKEKMLLQQLRGVYENAVRKTLRPLAVRCNYGTGILPSLFGAEIFWMDDELDTLPTARPLEGEDAIGRLLERGVPELTDGFGGAVFETAEYFLEALAPYPKLKEAVWIYHPDLQGPLDVLDMLWGSEIFYAFYEAPDKVKEALALVTETYAAFMKRWLETVPRKDPDYSAHWDIFHKGCVMLRDDSVVNLSPEMYAEFVKPFDDKLLEEFGGGAIHFCGRADHCIDRMTDTPHLTLVNMSQPEMNDMGKVYAATVGRGVVLNAPFRKETMEGLDLRRGVVLI